MKKARTDMKLVGNDISHARGVAPFSRRKTPAAAEISSSAPPEAVVSAPEQPSETAAAAPVAAAPAKQQAAPAKRLGKAASANRVGTLVSPYTRKRDQVETIGLRITVPKELRKQVAVYCAERELQPSQAWELAMRQLLKQA